LKKASWRESGYWSPAAAPGSARRWDAAFVALGAELIICGRRLELLEAAAAEMRSDLGGKVAAVRCDLRDGAAVDAMMDAILARGAARRSRQQCRGNLHRADRTAVVFAPRTRSWRRRCHGAMYCTHRRRQALDRRKAQGRRLSILSTSTITGRAFTVPSAMAKSAILAMTKSLAVEWDPRGSARWRLRPARFRR